MADFKRLEYSANLPQHKWWTGYDFPPKVSNQNFGDLLDDEITEQIIKANKSRVKYCRGEYSEVTYEETLIRIMLKLENFEAEDLKIIASSEYLTVMGKHEQRQDFIDDPSHSIEREFVRKYPLPKNAIYEEIGADYFMGKLMVKVPLDMRPDHIEVKIRRISSKFPSACIRKAEEEDRKLRDLPIGEEYEKCTIGNWCEKIEKDSKTDEIIEVDFDTLKDYNDLGNEILADEKYVAQFDKILKTYTSIPIVIQNSPSKEFSKENDED